ncbi:MAG: hypothetical protein ACLGSH_01815 [Acidobacteriota bacterium]
MARIRTIKPEFTESESIGKLSRDARLLFILLWTFVDDAGRARASSRLLASRLYPYDDDAVKKIGGWLEELELGEHIRLYEIDGDRYLDIPKWLKHQKIDHASKSRIPEYREDLANPRETLALHTSDLGPVPRTVDLGPSAPDGAVACATAEDIDQAFRLFNEAAKRTGWPAVQKLDTDRKRSMAARLKEVDGVEGFAIALGKAEASQFLTEQWGNFNLDWMLKPKNFRKLMEGNYDNRNREDPNARSLTAGLAGLAEAGSS